MVIRLLYHFCLTKGDICDTFLGTSRAEMLLVQRVDARFGGSPLWAGRSTFNLQITIYVYV